MQEPRRWDSKRASGNKTKSKKKGNKTQNNQQKYNDIKNHICRLLRTPSAGA